MPDRIAVQGAGKPGVDYIEVPTRDEAQLAALLIERSGYVQRGKPERVAQVDEQIERLGATPPKAELARGGVIREPIRPYLVGEEGPELVGELSAPVVTITATVEECTDGCVLAHPHAGPAITDEGKALEAGLVYGSDVGGYRARRKSGRPKLGE